MHFRPDEGVSSKFEENKKVKPPVQPVIGWDLTVTSNNNSVKSKSLDRRVGENNNVDSNTEVGDRNVKLSSFEYCYESQ